MEAKTHAFTLPEGGGYATLEMTVDDWGKMKITGATQNVLDMDPGKATPGPQGGHAKWSDDKRVELNAGEHILTVTHRNIDYTPASGNLSYCSYKCTVYAYGGSSSSSSSSSSSTSPSSSSSDSGGGSSSSSSCGGTPPQEQEICCECGTCQDREGNEYTPGPEDLPDDPESSFCFTAASYEPPAPPSSFLSRASSAPTAGGLRHESPWSWTLRYDRTSQLITVTPPSGAALYFKTLPGTDTAVPAGTSAKRNYRIQLLDENLQPYTGETPTSFSLVSAEGMKVRFSAATGQATAIASDTGKTVTAEAYCRQVKNTFDENGGLTASYSAAQGLMRTRTQNGLLIMEWYAPCAVTVLPDGGYKVTGEPYKTSSYQTTQEKGTKTTLITRQQRGLPPYVIKRVEEPGKVTIVKGEGDETIIRTIQTNRLFDNMTERIETVKGINDAAPAQCTRTVKQSTDGGWLTISETEAFNTPLARTTTYEYNAQYRISKTTYPDGGYTRYQYDALGRETLTASPWAGGGEKLTRTAYAENRFYDNRPSRVTESVIPENGTEIILTATDYSYEDTATSQKTTVRITATGTDMEHTYIHETWGETAPCPHAAGKIKLTRDISGLQTWHDYETTTEHGAAYTHTALTRVNEKLIAGQSTKTVKHIAANGTLTREANYIYAGTDWLPLSTAEHQYDEERRRNKTTRGNGRTNSTEWMCCGPLRETDENGVTTTYSYNSSRQLVETIRSAVMGGENEKTIITPETVTSYVRDAAGRALQTRKDTGAMSAVESTQYDLLGRIIRHTDLLGRVTNYSYSPDGLTETVTTPSGATLSTTRHTDGTILHEHGTARQELHRTYGAEKKGLIETTLLADRQTVLTQTISNGFGQTVAALTPATRENVFIRELSEYNAKGQLIRTQRDTDGGKETLAPTLYEYDAFGNIIKETLALANEPDAKNSRITAWAYGIEQKQDGVYRTTTTTRNNAAGQLYAQSTAQLISSLSPLLENKTIHTDARGNTSVTWTEYGNGASRLQKSLIPDSTITAQAQVTDGYTLTQTDHAGVTTSQRRTYTATGIIHVSTDPRGNVTTTQTDTAGRVIRVTDAAGNATTTQYCPCCDNPAIITNALGHTACYRYDIRGRKTAEWGTAIQPACFTYDEADRMTNVTTYRAKEGDITTDPTGRTDGDTTTWTYHDATGLEMKKTYADGRGTVTTYNAFNQTATRTDARGIVTTCAYAPLTAEPAAIAYSDGTPGQQLEYNHLGQLIQITDAAGVRTLSYNQYGEQQNDSLSAGGHTHLITELRDALGRSTGYTYARSGSLQHTAITAYGTDGRIASAGIMHGGAEKRFTYGYLKGTHLLDTLNMPNNITLTQSYEEKRSLITGITYKRGTTVVAERRYTHDPLGRPLTRHTERNGTTTSDAFEYNARSELTRTLADPGDYGYGYDNIGNRKHACELTQQTAYDANCLNQYTQITPEENTPFAPEHDAAGNQTKIKTSTGIWNIEYNADNRPIRFTSENGQTLVECTYDYMGRRHTRKITVNGNLLSHLRYIYRGYLQIAAIDAQSGSFQWFLLWDPTQPSATRPLAIRKDGTWYCYGWDITKNICEIFGPSGYIRTTYSYTPFGQATAEGDVSQPIQWSSEMHDDQLGLVYYNYRHYNPSDGRWFNRDPIDEHGGWNLYAFVKNNSITELDIVGQDLQWWIEGTKYNANLIWQGTKRTVFVIAEKGDQLNKKYKIVTRTAGVLQIIGGGMEATAGAIGIVAPEPTTTTGGVILFMHGSDVVTTGIRVLITGEFESTMTHDAIKKGAEAVGISSTVANNIATGAEVALGAKAFGTSTTKCCPKVLVEASNIEITTVSRWGSELKPNSWVMEGSPTIWNYMWSGKWQPGWGNQFVPPWKVNSYIVPKDSLSCPTGKGVDGFLKQLVPAKQRIYTPPSK